MLYRIFKLFPTLCLLLFHLNVAAQINTDSLNSIVKGDFHDSTKTRALIDLCWELKASDPELALDYGEKALNLSRKNKNKTHEATALKNIATIHLFRSNYSKSENYYLAAIKLFEELQNKKGLSGCYNNLGLVNELKGEFTVAMEYYQYSLKINEEIDNKPGIASSQTNIGNILQKQGNYRSSMEYYLKALKIKESLNEKLGIADAYNNIGALYEKQKAYEQAIKNYKNALMLYVEIDEKRKSGMVLHNIGFIHSLQKQYESAMDYYEQALELRRNFGDKQGVGSTLMNIGQIYFKTGKIKEAQEYYIQSQQIFSEIGNTYGVLETWVALAETYVLTGQHTKSIALIEPILANKNVLPEDLKHIYFILSQAYSESGNYSKAFQYQSNYLSLHDSLSQAESAKSILQIQLDYEFQKKQKEAEIEQEKQRLHNESELNRRRMAIVILSVCLAAFVLIAIFIYRGYRIKQKDNLLLEYQKNEIELKNKKLLLYQEELLSQKENLVEQNNLIQKQHNWLEEKNQRITDSIQYAKRIQNSLLPSEQEFRKNFDDYFILYRPKDVVSGDFYWFKELDDNILIAVADCTGHGVPGAFMSLLGISFLNEIVESGITNTAEILAEARERVKKALHQNSNQNEPKDGFEIGLCAIEKSTKMLKFSGAYLSLLILQNQDDSNNGVIEIPGDKMPIGSHIKHNNPFTVHTYQMQPNDKFFLFTDGYIDQFGGLYDRKFLPKKFKDILFKTKNLCLEDQKKALVESLENWMDEREQIDDILVVGLKFNG